MTTAGRDAGANAMDPERYLSRVGVDPATVGDPDRETLERLQRAHVATVPFETFAITGDPFGDGDGDGVSLVLDDLYRKIVDRRRGGFCFELNGLFGWLLAELGFDVDRLAGMMLDDDGDPSPPANHHPLLVAFDRPYLVDVGMGAPQMRRPLPVDGSTAVDDAGVEWRVVGSDRPDVDSLTQYREPGDDGWSDRYLFETTPRALGYFEATCEYLATAPESPFTGDPVATMATDRGYLKLKPGESTRTVGGETRTESVAEAEYHDVLEREFGLRIGPE